jgi:hypothetical protein
MRNMSFALTTPQMLRQDKWVTRRLGWQFLKVGDFLRPVKKCMGLKPGEKLEPVGACIEVVELRREPLRSMLEAPFYGQEECTREGFPDMTPAQFIEMFCRTHRCCTPDTVITRIEFRFMPEQGRVE